MAGAERLRGLAVLVIEDDFYVAEDTCWALETAGATVLGPYSEPPAFGPIMASGCPDCALVDVNLGQGPEFGSARELVDLGVPVIFITGYDRTTIPADLRHLPCIQKPALSSQIIAAIAAASKR